MCFGKRGKSAEDIYKEKKLEAPEEKPLPSLSMKPVERGDQELGDVPYQRKGMQRRTLLGGY
jgi:hypothetical protein